MRSAKQQIHLFLNNKKLLINILLLLMVKQFLLVKTNNNLALNAYIFIKNYQMASKVDMNMIKSNTFLYLLIKMTLIIIMMMMMIIIIIITICNQKNLIMD